jgi:acyl-CoA synthetase (AMP-forming)/AMP-acid ligase II
LRHSRVTTVVSSPDQVSVIRDDAPPGVAVVDFEQLQEAADAVSTPAIARQPATHPFAYIQYSSGTVTDPKPIVLGQKHVLAHLSQAAAVYRENTESVSVNWVPLFHDMGLVTSVLRPLFSGYTSVILDPADFVRRPAAWPLAMSDWAATHTSSPDFGYVLAATRSPSLHGLDLSRLEVARSAGETVRAATLETFTRAFAAAGFRPEAFTPSYGLAEATLTVTTCDPIAPPRLIDASRQGLRAHRLRPPIDEADAYRLVSCGRPLPGTTVVIVDEQGDLVPGDGYIGEIFICGPQVTPGVEHPKHPGLRPTGDFGFLHEGELVLIGRSKERFQLHGENYYCSEIEEYLCAAQPHLRRGRVALLPPIEDPDAHARACVIAELRRPAWERFQAGQLDPEPVRRSIVSALARGFGLPCRNVSLVAPGTLPVTTSGKLLRHDIVPYS